MKKYSVIMLISLLSFGITEVTIGQSLLVPISMPKQPINAVGDDEKLHKQLLEASRHIPTEQLNEANALDAVNQGVNAGQIDLAAMPIEDAVALMMSLAANEADKELKGMMAEMDKTRKQKASKRTPHSAVVEQSSAMRDQAANEMKLETVQPPMDSVADISEMDQIRLQMLMDRRQKAQEMLSNLIKKQSEAESNIINNIK